MSYAIMVRWLEERRGDGTAALPRTGQSARPQIIISRRVGVTRAAAPRRRSAADRNLTGARLRRTG